MLLTFLEKIKIVIKLFSSSFLEIELGILTLLLFLILVVNLKNKKKVYNYLISLIMIIFLGIVIFINYDYAIYFIDILLKSIMKYIYFPSAAIYFLIVFLAVVCLIITIFKNNLSKAKKFFNYLMFSGILYMFLSFMSEVYIKKLDLMDSVSLYTNNNVLALVQISNFIFIVWIVVTFFYKLYQFFKKKYDK